MKLKMDPSKKSFNFFKGLKPMINLIFLFWRHLTKVFPFLGIKIGSYPKPFLPFGFSEINPSTLPVTQAIFLFK